jgi:hypothetical protein
MRTPALLLAVLLLALVAGCGELALPLQAAASTCAPHFIDRATGAEVVLAGTVDWRRFGVACVDPRGWGWCESPAGDWILPCYQDEGGEWVGCSCR